MGQAHINARTRACSRTSIARTKQAALTHHVRGKELNKFLSPDTGPHPDHLGGGPTHGYNKCCQV